MRLGCLVQCQQCVERVRKEYLNSLPEHRAYMASIIDRKEELCAQEFADNSKIYFLSPADVGAIPPVSPIAIVPTLEYLPPGYMNMINAPRP